MSVTEYKLKFEDLVFECGFKIDLPIIYMFYNGLRPDFKRELILHVMKSVKETFLLALELLELSTFKTRGRCFTCEGYGHYVYECPSNKCSK